MGFQRGFDKSVLLKVLISQLMSSKDDLFADSIFSHRKRMETISEILEGEIYLSSLLAATQAGESLNGKGITHVISILKEPFSRHASVEYLVVGEDDSADTDLLKHFQAINAFIGTFLSVSRLQSLCVVRERRFLGPCGGGGDVKSRSKMYVADMSVISKMWFERCGGNDEIPCRRRFKR